MLARRHRLRLGEEGIVGYVSARGEPRVVPDVEQDRLYYRNPDLPDTRSEIAVPLTYQGRVIGVLDVQDTDQAAFHRDDVLLMQTLSDLIVVAIRNVRLFASLRAEVIGERRAYAELTERAWLERTRRTGPVAYRYEGGEVVRSATQMIGGGEPVEHQASLPEVTLPVSVRGRVIGTLQAHKLAGSGGWSAGEREAMESLVAQLDAALEGARLYEDTQLLAARERILAQITAKMRETLDVQTVLRTAADEVYRALDLEEVGIRLVGPSELGEGLDRR
jgi:GAF domain-containing protein